MSTTLTRLGWRPGLEHEFEPHAAEGCVPGRVAAQHRGGYVVFTERGERRAETSGRLVHLAAGPADLPVVGDWVALQDGGENSVATMQALVARHTSFSRRAVGEETAEQVVAANVDVVFLMSAFGPDLNLRRLERYLASAWESGALPVVVLNKRDVSSDPAGETAEVEAIAFGVPVHAVSCATGEGIVELRAYLTGDRTVALLGSSGVGKTTLVNRLVGKEIGRVAAVRESDGRGRHTTTHRELLLVPGGGLLLDTPGMRVLGLWAADAGLEGTFDDIGALTAVCRFNDCTHQREPGCEVLAAVADGRLAAERLASYRKLLRELASLEIKQDGRLRAEARRERRRFARSMRRSSW